MDRLANCAALSNTLARLTDEELVALMAKAQPLHAGVGGRSILLTIDSTPIFVKGIPLTDLERRQEHVRSTANIFDIPLSCHYGLGGPGFSAWRESHRRRSRVPGTPWSVRSRSRGRRICSLSQHRVLRRGSVDGESPHLHQDGAAFGPARCRGGHSATGAGRARVSGVFAPAARGKQADAIPLGDSGGEGGKQMFNADLVTDSGPVPRGDYPVTSSREYPRSFLGGASRNGL